MQTIGYSVLRVRGFRKSHVYSNCVSSSSMYNSCKCSIRLDQYLMSCNVLYCLLEESSSSESIEEQLRGKNLLFLFADSKTGVLEIGCSNGR